jgi:uncharacterized HAD superfamily protein
MADSLPEAIIVDTDGTLVDVSGIRHYVAPGRRFSDFDRFHKASRFSPPHADVVDRVLAEHTAGRTVFVVTARRDRHERLTRDWLAKHDVPFDHLLMRKDTDRRHDVDVKRGILARIRKTHRVVLAIDDNPGVIALWRSQHIPVIVVPGWDDPIVLPEDFPGGTAP